MTLSQLLQDVSVNGNFTDVEITDVTDNSRKVTKNCVFVCVKGERTDGHGFAAQALENGAAYVIAQKDLGLENQLVVKDTRAAYSAVCSAYFGHPSRKLKLVGVTGTNGKTTTAYMLKEILEGAGHKVGLIGTIEDIVGEVSFDARRTTPDAYELHRLFKKMVDAGCEYCIMEVSSQALAQGRVYGCEYETAVFTNLTQDHLDYHLTMENYLAAKKLLFYAAHSAAVNADDKYAESIIAGTGCRAVTFSVREDSDYRAREASMFPGGSHFWLTAQGETYSVNLPVPGEFSVLNALGAIAAAQNLGIEIKTIVTSLAHLRGVRGRMEFVPINRDFTLIIDYAHTPDGLENVLKTLSGLKKGRLITVFGCGGDRDKTKRLLMGQVSAKMSDYSVITSDNPRTEDPMKIIGDILPAFSSVSKTAYHVQPDRKEAIAHALGVARSGDVVLLAGKGHECYQILKDSVISFDEREIVKELLSINEESDRANR